MCWEFEDHFRETGPGTANGADWQSMPEYFKTHGYVTLGSGKLYHPQVPPDNDVPKSWSVDVAPYYSPECTGGPGGRCPSSSARGPASGPYHCLMSDPPGPPGHKPTFCATNVSIAEDRFEFQLEDQRIRDSAIAHLKLAKTTGKPFFVGAGFRETALNFEPCPSRLLS
jgi:iduronate 2-sulfatase